MRSFDVSTIFLSMASGRKRARRKIISQNLSESLRLKWKSPVDHWPAASTSIFSLQFSSIHWSMEFPPLSPPPLWRANSRWLVCNKSPLQFVNKSPAACVKSSSIPMFDQISIFLLVVWLPFFIVPLILGFDYHPNWRTHIFQRCGPTTNQLSFVVANIWISHFRRLVTGVASQGFLHLRRILADDSLRSTKEFGVPRWCGIGNPHFRLAQISFPRKHDFRTSHRFQCG